MSTPRYDIYLPIHKALRAFMADTLGRVGWLDAGDASELQATLQQADALLALCRSHLEHENRFLHPAIEARCPGGTQQAAADHVEHEEAIAALGAEVAALRAAPSQAGANRLYRRLALFVADNFQHMHLEETAHNQALWASCRDEEIQAIEHALVASLDEDEKALVMRWMLPSIAPSERAGMFAGMRSQVPEEVFAQSLAGARALLSPRAMAKLDSALHPEVPPA